VAVVASQESRSRRGLLESADAARSGQGVEEPQRRGLSALDYRIAAEILLLFYEDLAARGQADPLPDVPRNGWHPLAERLSYRGQTLDEDLMHLGISPHPRVVLAIEGETEQIHVPLIWKQLDYPGRARTAAPADAGRRRPGS
jgi:hypothetical protein